MRRDLARFRPQNLAAAKKIRKFWSEIRCESRAISPLLACRRSAQLLGTSEGRGEAARHQAARISARSRVISTAKFCGREKKFSVRNSSENARNCARGVMPTIRSIVVANANFSGVSALETPSKTPVFLPNAKCSVSAFGDLTKRQIIAIAASDPAVVTFFFF